MLDQSTPDPLHTKQTIDSAVAEIENIIVGGLEDGGMTEVTVTFDVVTDTDEKVVVEADVMGNQAGTAIEQHLTYTWTKN